MTSILMRVILFFSSYSPLWLIFGIQLYAKAPPAAVGCIVLAMLSIVGMFGYLWLCRHGRLQQSFDKVTRFQRKDSDVMSYITSYLIPFITATFDAPQQILTTAIFLLVLLIVYINTNMLFINPILTISRYRLYEIELEHGQQSHYYIARKRLSPNEMIYFVRVHEDFYVEL